MNLFIWITSFIQAIGLMVLVSIKCKLRLIPSIFKGLLIGVLTALIIQIIQNKFLSLSHMSILIFGLGIIIFAIILCVILLFYRDPERTPPQKDNVILSPADGTVRYVKRIEKGVIPFAIKKGNTFHLHELLRYNMTKDDTYLIGVEMNIFNVHVNRAPVGGKIIFQKRYKGKFLSLRDIQSLFKNDRVTTVIDQGQFKIGVVQIASRIVRRIVSYIQEGSKVTIGERIGMIKFGSQVDVILPVLKNMKINVKSNDQIKAGTTIIAQYHL